MIGIFAFAGALTLAALRLVIRPQALECGMFWALINALLACGVAVPASSVIVIPVRESGNCDEECEGAGERDGSDHVGFPPGDRSDGGFPGTGRWSEQLQFHTAIFRVAATERKRRGPT